VPDPPPSSSCPGEKHYWRSAGPGPEDSGQSKFSVTPSLHLGWSLDPRRPSEPPKVSLCSFAHPPRMLEDSGKVQPLSEAHLPSLCEWVASLVHLRTVRLSS
jgi:hypothetical protein